MERTTSMDAMAGSADRDHREQLEQVQMELRKARLTLQTASDDAAREEQSLREAILEATVLRDESAARLMASKEECRNVSGRLQELAPRLEAKRQEDQLLERGARLKDAYVDWNPEDARNQVGDGMTVRQVKLWALALGSGLLLLAGYLWLT